MKTLASFLLVLAPFLSRAQFGTLDANFDADGILSVGINGTNTFGLDAVQAGDGKLLLCGYNYDGGSRMFVKRVHPDGSNDNTFYGTNGLNLIQFVSEEANCMALQPDGKIILAGTGQGPNGRTFIVVRLLGGGALDSSFGSNGLALVEIGQQNDVIKDVVIQADGKIVAAGYTDDQIDRDIALIRLNTDGTLDNTFSFDGKVITSVGSSGNQALCSGVVLGSNGSITVAGRSKELSSDAEAVLIRYQSDGSLDNGFGVNGVVKNDFGVGTDVFHDLAVDGSGKIVACGYSGSSSTQNMLLARFNTDGSIDNTFSFDGFVKTDFFGASDGANSIVIQPDSKILVGGATSNGTSIFALARYNADGTLDNTFGTNGKVSTEIGTTSSIESIILQSDLAIVACGFANDGGLNAVLARYTSGMNVGIGEVEAYIGSTLIYPNPITDNQVTIEYELKSDEEVSIELFDLSGKLIIQLQAGLHQQAGSYQKTLSLPMLSAGNYLLKLNTEKGAVTVKLTVN